MFKKAFLGAAMALATVTGANAATVTISGNLTATDWAVYFGAPSAPIDPLFLNYSITFDDAANYNGDASVLTLGATNVPYALTFSHNSGQSTFVLATEGSPSGCSHPPSSFCAFINYSTLVPFFVEQSPPDGSGGWFAQTITGSSDFTPGAAPEPLTWSLMIAGFGLAGAALRRRRTRVAA